MPLDEKAIAKAQMELDELVKQHAAGQREIRRLMDEQIKSNADAFKRAQDEQTAAAKKAADERAKMSIIPPGVLADSVAGLAAVVAKQEELRQSIKQMEQEQGLATTQGEFDALAKKIAEAHTQLKSLQASAAKGMPGVMAGVPGLAPSAIGTNRMSDLSGRDTKPETAEQRAARIAIAPYAGGVQYEDSLTPSHFKTTPQEGKLAKMGDELLAIFSPMSIVGQVFSGLLQELGKELLPIIQIVGSMLSPVLKLIIPPLKLLAIVASYVVEGLGWLVKSLGQAVNAIVPFGSPADGLVKLGRDMQQSARDARKAMDHLGETLDQGAARISETLRNVPLSFNAALARYQVATTVPGRDTSGGGVNINGPITIQADKDDSPYSLWQKFVRGARDAADRGDPLARRIIEANRVRWGIA
jgi:hypothetical protein